MGLSLFINTVYSHNGNTDLELLDGLLKFGDHAGVILKTSVQVVDLAILLSDKLFHLSLDSLEVLDGFLSHLQVSLYLPLGLLYISSYLLLSLQGILKL